MPTKPRISVKVKAIRDNKLRHESMFINVNVSDVGKTGHLALMDPSVTTVFLLPVS